MEGDHTRVYNGTEWIRSNHDLDFIFSKDSVVYGVEVKNQLGYMNHDELRIKIAMCRALEIRPVFVVRMMPAGWINELWKAGGFALILKYQLYPLPLKNLAKRMREELGLPADAPKALEDGTMQRFLNWHYKHVK